MEPPDYSVQHRSTKVDKHGATGDNGHAEHQSHVQQRQQAPAAHFYGYGHASSSSHSSGPELFQDAARSADTGYYYGQQQQQQTGGYYNPLQNFSAGGQLVSEPVIGLAASYGQQFAQQGKEKISQVLPLTRLKYYFAVDTKYVMKKLLILLFPFMHLNWSMTYMTKEEPVAPRFDVNAPDLYIPLMAFVTYVFVAGFALGTQGRFSPEQLGLLASSATAWLLLEIGLLVATKYLMNIQRAIGFFETLAFIGYKYVGMIVSLVAYLIGGRSAYFVALVYSSLAITFFMIRSVRGAVLSDAGGDEGRRRKLYLTLFIALSQPFIVWWLTSSVATADVAVLSAGAAGLPVRHAGGGGKGGVPLSVADVDNEDALG